jgi:hypothetical protein
MSIARRGRTVRKSLRDTLDTNAKSLNTLLALAGKPPMPIPASVAMGTKRVITHHSEKEELEGAVMREVAEIILLSPRVHLAWRQNGGAAQAPDGIFRIWFYRWVKRPVKEMVLVDFLGVLQSGHMLAIECKRRDWHYTGTEREQAQKAFIDRIIAAGGRGGFVTNAEQALAILK